MIGLVNVSIREYRRMGNSRWSRFLSCSSKSYRVGPETGTNKAWRRRKVKKLLESDYPHPEGGALRPIHGFATAISKIL